jgi:hypothetical protein
MDRETVLRRIGLRRGLIVAVALLALLLSCNTVSGGGGPAPSGSPPLADYGDAPDGGPTGYPQPFAQTGGFPTLFASDGARTLNLGPATLGPAASAEVDAADQADPDGAPNLVNADLDDGLVDLFIRLVAIPPPATLTVNVSAPAGSPGGDYFVNALIDLNMDGQWGGEGANGESEWAVRNEPVTASPGAASPFTFPPFAFANGLLLPDGAFMRVALTSEAAPQGWDGRGQFGAGEIEDHFIALPVVDGKKSPILGVDCGGPYKPGDQVTCTVSNLRADAAGTFTYSLEWLAGGTVNVPIASCAPASPAAIAAGGSVAVTCSSTAGTTPTTWRFLARVQDPASRVVTGGIQVGHTEHSTAAFDFEASGKQPCIFVASLQAAVVHGSGSSTIHVSATLLGADPEPVPGASLILSLTRPDGSRENLTLTAEADGAASGDFTIFTYGSYRISVENVEAEGFSYVPGLNIASSLQVDVTAAEDSHLAFDRVRAFYEDFNQAYRSGSVDALLRALHRSVRELYGTEVCRAYLAATLADSPSVQVKSVLGFGPWTWERDGQTLLIDDAYTVLVDRTIQGAVEQAEVHLALQDDASLGWFTDCGEPLP